jgi:hypothetical protein
MKRRRLPKRCQSFRKASDTQAMIEQARYRQEKSKRHAR